MATKISELTAVSTLDGSELIPVVQGGVTKQTSIADLSEPVACRVSLASNQAISGASDVAFDTIEYDTTNDWDSINNRYQPTVAGYYTMTFCAEWDTNTTMTYCYYGILKNDNYVARSLSRNASISTGNSESVATTVYLNGTTDYVSGHVSPENAGVVSGSVETTNFTASLIKSPAPATAGAAITFDLKSSSNQAIPNGAYTLIDLQTVNNDSDSIYNTSTNRLQPTTAGMYQINAFFWAEKSGTPPLAYLKLEKNGSERVGYYENNVTATGGAVGGPASAIVYFNGTTDYLEFFGYIAGGTGIISSTTVPSRLSGFLIK